MNWRSPKRTQSNPILFLFPLWKKKEKKGVVLDKFGVFWEQFGVIWAQFGVVLDCFGNKKTSKNTIFDIENAETIVFM